MKLRKDESIEWIAARRSVYPRMFETGDLGEREILDLLSVAQWAPTHKLTQPWRFKVFMGGQREKLAVKQGEALVAAAGEAGSVTAKVEKMKDNAQRAAAVIAIILHRDPLKAVPEFEEMCAVACAVQNIWLHAASMGLGGYWSTGGGTNHPVIRNLLDLAADDRHLGWFYLGHFSGELPPRPPRLSVEEYTEIVR